MFDIYPKLPIFLRKHLFVNRYVLERLGLREAEAHQIANEALMELLFTWHKEHFDKHSAYTELATLRELEPSEMEQDTCAVNSMSFLEDAAAFLAARESGKMPVDTLRSYLEAKLILTTDILEGEAPHLALGQIVSKLRHIEASASQSV